MSVTFEGKTTDRDMGWQHLLKELRAADEATVEVGIFDNEKHPGTEYTVAQIGAVHEFGTKPTTVPHIPERSWMRTTLTEKEGEFDEFQGRLLGQVLSGGAMFAKLTAFGEFVAGAMRRKITDLKEPPKAIATLEREGSGFTNPLIWLGYMRASVRSRIHVGSRKKMTAKGPVSES